MAEVGAFFGAATMVGILIGVSARSRRRRVWRGVAGLVGLHGKSVSFSLMSVHYSLTHGI